MKKIILIGCMLLSISLNANVLEELERGCNEKDFQKCTTLAILYSKGEVVKKDISKSVDYYTKACDGKNMDGCANLGYLYMSGSGVKQDFGKAIELYTKTCNKTKKVGCTNLGLLYSKGNGVGQDAKKAVKFYEMACSAGDVSGCYNLGEKFRIGSGVKKDLTQAMKFYKISCDSGYAYGCYNLAFAYHTGIEDIDIDTSKALDLYAKACDLKFNEGCVSHDILKKKPKVTCETLDKLGWHYVGANFKRTCNRFGVDVNIEQVANSFLAKSSEFPEKRTKMVNDCKKECKDNKECIEKLSIAIQQMGNNMKKKRLKNKTGCENLNAFLDSKKNK